MKLEDQVCSLELAKRLKELGVKQESLWFWRENYNLVRGGECEPDGKFALIFVGERRDLFHKGKCEAYSAFTVAELGEMLPVCIRSVGELQIYRDGDSGGWLAGYDEMVVEFAASGRTMANALSKLLIHLIEKGIIKPKGVNKMEKQKAIKGEG